MKGKVKSIFFDLDHTIWDLEKNAEETLIELFDEFGFNKVTTFTSLDFVASFSKFNEQQWVLYEKKLIDKPTLRENRFRLAMSEIGIPPENQPLDMWNHFLERCPQRTNLIPNAKEVLDILSGKYPLYIITNGFSETQRLKLQNAGLSHYFEKVIISEEIGWRKPQKEIFEYAQKLAMVIPKEAVMIGDSLETDVKGSIEAGWNSVFYNPNSLTNPHQDVLEIKSLLELKDLL